MTERILQYRGAFIAVGFLVALIAAQTPVAWAMMAAIGMGVLAQFLPDLVERYGLATTFSALAAIILFTAVTIYTVTKALS
jgi:hypothetical protein